MTAVMDHDGARRATRWRLIGWTIAGLLLLVPLLAMQVTSEMDWSLRDFILAAVMLGIAGGTIELGARLSRNRWYRGGAFVAVAAALLQFMVNGAVGVLGDEDNPANLLFLAVIALAGVGAVVARLRAAGMARAMLVTAAAQAIVAIGALIAGLASPGADGVKEVVLVTTLFGGLWLLSAALFRRAAQDG